MIPIGVMLAGSALADLGFPKRNEDSMVADDLRETNRGHVEVHHGFRDNPPGWQDEPVGHMENPFGHRDEPFGFRKALPGETNEPAGFQEDHPRSSADESLRIPKDTFESEVVADDLRDTPPNYLDSHLNESEASGLREDYVGLDEAE